jgi:hypothetical protein
VNNRRLDRDALTAKLDARKGQVKELVFTKKAAIESRDNRYAALHKALQDDDVSTVVHWMNVMAGSDDDHQIQVTKALIRGVAESAGRKVSDPTGNLSKGMRWGQDVKDVSAALLMTAGPKVTRFLQANVHTPALRTATRHRDSLREPFVLDSDDEGYHIRNFERVARVWNTVRKRLEANGELRADDVLPYEIKIDETPIDVSMGPSLARNYDARGKPTGQDFVVGFCGKTINAMVNIHPCVPPSRLLSMAVRTICPWPILRPQRRRLFSWHHVVLTSAPHLLRQVPKKKGSGMEPGHRCEVCTGYTLDHAGAEKLQLTVEDKRCVSFGDSGLASPPSRSLCWHAAASRAGAPRTRYSTRYVPAANLNHRTIH